MNTDSTSLTDLQSLLGGGSGGITGGASLIDTDSIIKAMMPITIILTVISVVISILYIVSLVHRIRVSKASIETRDILREMNERDKLRGVPTASAVPAPTDSPISEVSVTPPQDTV